MGKNVAGTTNENVTCINPLSPSGKRTKTFVERDRAGIFSGREGVPRAQRGCILGRPRS